MNPPSQILSALLVAVAVSVLPLSSVFQDAATLTEAAEKRAAAATAASPGSGKPGTGKSGAASATTAGASAAAVRIPPGVSPADAARIISELKGLDGKMLSSRRIIALLDGIMSLPESHLEEARAAIIESKNPIMGGFLCSALFSRWGELDPDGARVALEASGSTNPIFKFAGAASLAGGWLEKNPDAFLKWINEPREGMSAKDREMRDIMMNGVLGIANVDSATAEKLIAAAPKERRAWMILDMAERDPNMDPRAAAARALEEAGDNEGQRSSINWRIGKILAERDPKEAISYAQEQAPKDRGKTYEAAMSSWVREDKTEAMKWLKTQPADVQADAVGGLRGQLGKMEFDDVAKLSSDLKGDAPGKVWSLAVSEKAATDPAAAAGYLSNVSEAQRPGSYNEVAREWTQKNPQAASEWVYDLTPGREKDHAIQGMVQELRSKEPDSSTIWASTIGDEKMRGLMVAESAGTWLKRDRAAAEDWINTTDTISDDQKEKLLQKK